MKYLLRWIVFVTCLTLSSLTTGVYERWLQTPIDLPVATQERCDPATHQSDHGAYVDSDGSMLCIRCDSKGMVSFRDGYNLIVSTCQAASCQNGFVIWGAPYDSPDSSELQKLAQAHKRH